MTIDVSGRLITFPEKGMTSGEVTIALKNFRVSDEDPRATFDDRWQNDRGLLVDDGVIKIAKSAYLAFFTKNNSYPSVMTMEQELIGFALDIFQGDRASGGRLTSGGSESLFLATMAAVREARKRRPELAEPEVLLSEGGYPTFEKYSRFLGYKVRRVPVDRHFRGDPDALAKAINDQTVMIVASVSSWSHGACDPVPELSKLAQDRGIWLHVDACVGGFLAPFVRDLGRPIPEFGFSVPGVASISSDFHKYGYSAKGVSGVFFRDKDVARHLTFTFDDWAAGLYRSPVFTGTRSGGAIAAAWAVARYLGREGYRARAAQILKARDAIATLVASTEGLCLIGGADLATVAVGGQDLDIYAVASSLKARGWAINLLKDPAGIQFVLGPLRDKYIDLLLADIADAVERVRAGTLPNTVPSVIYSDEIIDS